MLVLFAGGGYFAGVCHPWQCVSIRLFVKSDWSNEFYPRKQGVNLKAKEWQNLVENADVLADQVGLDGVVPCCTQHRDADEIKACVECHVAGL